MISYQVAMSFCVFMSVMIAIVGTAIVLES